MSAKTSKSPATSARVNVTSPTKDTADAGSELSGDDDNEEYEVQQILGMRLDEEGKREFRVKWKGYATKHNSWEPESGLESAKEAIQAYIDKTSTPSSSAKRRAVTSPGKTKKANDEDNKGTGDSPSQKQPASQKRIRDRTNTPSSNSNSKKKADVVVKKRRSSGDAADSASIIRGCVKILGEPHFVLEDKRVISAKVYFDSSDEAKSIAFDFVLRNFTFSA